MGQVQGPSPKMGRKVMNISQSGIDHIKKSEGYRNKGYYATPYEESKGVVTVGHGATGRVGAGEEIDELTAQKFLREDLKTSEDAVRRLVHTPLTQNQFDALTSLVFNVGQGNFAKSNALKALNEGDIEKFKFEAFDKDNGFIKQGGVVVEGLVKRRSRERDLFEG